MLITTLRRGRFRQSRAGELVGDVDAAFGHCSDCGGVDFVSGFGSAGLGDGVLAGQSLKESEGHLRPAGVVGT